MKQRGYVRAATASALLVGAALAIAIWHLNRGGSPAAPTPTDESAGVQANESSATGDAQNAATGGAAAAAPATGVAPDAPSFETRSAAPGSDAPTVNIAGPRFTVFVAPLGFTSDDGEAEVVFQSLYQRLLAELSAIPNIFLIDPDTAARLRIDLDAIDFKLDVGGQWNAGPFSRWSFHVSWTATRGGHGTWVAPDDASGPMDVEALAYEAAEALRRFPFPPEDRRQLELEAEVLDANRSYEERFAALDELHDIPKRYEFVGRDEQHTVAIAGAEIVVNARDPQIRGKTWQAMSGLTDPYLIGPLSDSLLLDASDFVRYQAAISLISQFKENPTADAALEYALENDLSPKVRAYVRWAFLDDDGRRDYIASTLLNGGLTDADRLALVDANVDGLYRYIDRQTAMALVDIASRARPSSEAEEAAPEENAADDQGEESEKGTVEASEIVPVLIELINEEETPEVRSAASTALVRFIDEPGVRVALQEMSRNDSSYVLRSQVRYDLARAAEAQRAKQRSVGQSSGNGR